MLCPPAAIAAAVIFFSALVVNASPGMVQIYSTAGESVVLIVRSSAQHKLHAGSGRLP